MIGVARNASKQSRPSHDHTAKGAKHRLKMIDTTEKLAGFLIPPFALRREGDLGIGDTQAVIEAIDFCAANNASVLQLLPINETGGDNSPYNAISSVSLDPVLLTMAPTTVPGKSSTKQATLAVPGLTQPDLDRLAPAGHISKLQGGAVKYPLVKQLKLSILRQAFENFRAGANAGANKDEMEQFRQFQHSESGWLESYCVFRTLMDLHSGSTSWVDWPEAQRDPQKAKEWIKSQSNADQLNELREFYAFVQWVASQQWRKVREYADKLSVRLIGDIPFALSRFSSDVWAEQELFDLSWSGGAPREWMFQGDSFTAKWGQNWGFPIYKWDAHKHSGFAWWHQRVHKVTEIFHGFRIDHVLGFFRMYAFPWVPQRNDEFLNLTEQQVKEKTGGRLPRFIPRSDEAPADAAANAAEGKALLQMILDAAGGAFVVAEDLGGQVADYVHEVLQQLGIPGFSIPQWDRPLNAEYKQREELPVLTLATYATHDHMPLVGFYEEMVRRWVGPDGHQGWLEMQRLMRFLRLDENDPPKQFTAELHEAFMQALVASPSWLVVFMISDLLAINDRFNQPGTSDESSWSVRLAYPLSQYQNTMPFKAAIASFSRLVKQCGRLPHAWQVGTIRKGKEDK